MGKGGRKSKQHSSKSIIKAKWNFSHNSSYFGDDMEAYLQSISELIISKLALEDFSEEFLEKIPALSDMRDTSIFLKMYKSITRIFLKFPSYRSSVIAEAINYINRQRQEIENTRQKYEFLGIRPFEPLNSSRVEVIGVIKVHAETKMPIELMLFLIDKTKPTSQTNSIYIPTSQTIGFDAMDITKHRRTISLRAARKSTLAVNIQFAGSKRSQYNESPKFSALLDLLQATLEELKEVISHLNGFKCQTHLFSEADIKDLSGRTPLDSTEVYPSTNNAMESEQQRQMSFRLWPLTSSVSTQTLVEAGFYSSDCVLEIVECFSCRLSLGIRELNGRHPLDVHRERSPDCQFLKSENFRETSFNNTQLPQFERLMMNDTDTNEINGEQNSHCPSPVSGIKESSFSNESDLAYRNLGKRTDIAENHVEEISEKIQSSLSFSLVKHSCISQPSDEVAHETQIQREVGAKLLLSGTDQNPRNLTDFHFSFSHRRDSRFPQQDRANNGRRIDEETEGATAAISTFVRSPTEDSSAPPPRNILYEQDNARRESFNAWNGRHDIDSLVDAGLFYTGDQDIVRCFNCDIGLAEWNREDDPWLEHARHSHECHFLIRMKGQAYVDDVQREWAKVYSPKRPDLSHIDRRRETFHNWPTDFVVQTPDQLATAGFYYSGETDTVRCHYCDGGLREWEPGDIPWVEHAKWFPHCKFVLKIKGLPFIQQCVARRNEVVEDTVPDNAREQNEALNRFRAPISSEEKYRAQEENNPLRTAAAEAILAMGYTTAVVSKCINVYIANTGHKNFGASDLMNIILDKEDEGGNLSSDGETGGNETEFRYEGAALVKINETLKQKQLCIECRQRGRKILFQPCGHLLLCNICAQKYTKCVLCGGKITSRANVFMS